MPPEEDSNLLGRFLTFPVAVPVVGRAKRDLLNFGGAPAGAQKAADLMKGSVLSPKV